ncbi:MAG: Lrp/AsnC ligand binding domain-containing protein [Chloroflexota bacterium]
MMKAYVLINAVTGEVRDVVRQLRRVEKVTEANLTFGPYDAVAIVEADDIDKVGMIVYQEIQPIPGVIDTLTCLVVNTD